MVLDFIFLVITYSGGYLVVGLTTFLACLSFLLHGHKNNAIRLLVSVLGTGISVYILKILLNAPRPQDAFYIESTAAFPSGHAALAVALYGFLFISIWKHEKHHLQNKSLVLLALLILLIGFSRLYLGVHYFWDVIAGYVIGLIWLKISLLKLRVT